MMKFEEAIKVQSKIADKFLFSRARQVAYAGDHDIGQEEWIAEMFKSIVGTGVGGSDEEGYRVYLYASVHLEGWGVIPEYFGVDRGEFGFIITEPFTFHSKIESVDAPMPAIAMGGSISHHLSQEQGTIGCFVEDRKTGDKFILSNRHVLFNGDVRESHDFILHPGLADGGKSPGDAIGTLTKYLPYDPSGINEFDAALAGPLARDFNPLIPEIGLPVSGMSPLKKGVKVYKFGSESKKTYGKILTYPTNLTVQQNGKKIGFKNQVVIKGKTSFFDKNSFFSRSGDSGSLVINFENHSAVGLLFAGTPSGFSAANPIESVLNNLEVGICIKK